MLSYACKSVNKLSSLYLVTKFQRYYLYYLGVKTKLNFWVVYYTYIMIFLDVKITNLLINIDNNINFTIYFNSDHYIHKNGDHFKYDYYINCNCLYFKFYYLFYIMTIYYTYDNYLNFPFFIYSKLKYNTIGSSQEKSSLIFLYEYYYNIILLSLSYPAATGFEKRFSPKYYKIDISKYNAIGLKVTELFTSHLLTTFNIFICWLSNNPSVI